MKIVIIPNEKKDKGFQTTKQVVKELLSHGADVCMDASLPYPSGAVTKYDDFPAV